MKSADYFNFERLVCARFIGRPNRFTVRCRNADLGTITAYLPNPGRLWELLLPDATLYLTPNNNPDGKTRYTVLAVEREGEPVFLHTHLAGRIAASLIERRKIPALKNAQVIRNEISAGGSRFDLLLKEGDAEVLAEVKSCTLFGNGVAMFPDAVTERGRRHLIDLVAQSKGSKPPVVIFLVQTQRVSLFAPDYHTDLAFGQTLLELRNRLRIVPVAVGWTRNLRLKPRIVPLEIPWKRLEGEIRDVGSYMLILHVPHARKIIVGKLGMLEFPRGYYIYVGSAMRNLSARLMRHQRRRKRLKWHIDFLREAAARIVALPVRSSRRLECRIAARVGGIFEQSHRGFGCSDCNCETHLYFSEDDPLHMRRFHDLLLDFRTEAIRG